MQYVINSFPQLWLSSFGEGSNITTSGLWAPGHIAFIESAWLYLKLV